MNNQRTLGVLAGAACLLLGGCNSSLFGTASSASQTEIITAARILRLYQGFEGTVVANLINSPSGAVEYDGNLYYYKAQVSGTVTTITYYGNSGGTISEGTVTVNNTTPTGSTTQIYSVSEDITGLTRPVETTTLPTNVPLSLTIGPGNSPITVSGSFTETPASGQFPVTWNITNTGGVLSGSVSCTAFGNVVTFSNLSGTTTGLDAYTLTGTVSVGTNTQTFNEVINYNGSGHGSLTDGTTLNWAQDGTATLVTSSGDINVANIDGGQ